MYGLLSAQFPVFNPLFSSVQDGRANHVMRVRNRGLSSMATLPENKMLLLGMDIGTISLLA